MARTVIGVLIVSDILAATAAHQRGEMDDKRSAKRSRRAQCAVPHRAGTAAFAAIHARTHAPHSRVRYQAPQLSSPG